MKLLLMVLLCDENTERASVIGYYTPTDTDANTIGLQADIAKVIISIKGGLTSTDVRLLQRTL